ncbi:hypothetical protein CL622_08470 [archaeon]|nr:hypothetical protein [archaeon]
MAKQLKSSNDNNGDSNSGKYNLRVIDNFDNMGLDDAILHGIYSMGFEKPSYIQQRGILPIMEGKDVIAQSQSGTGKTATFTIGTLQIVEKKVHRTQAIIIAPTRELASQINTVISDLGLYLNLTRACIIGGTSIRDNITELSKHPQIIIGTPGRLFDMISKRYIDTRSIKLLVIDEADEMLSQGFDEQIKNIFKTLPEEVQVALFSATMSDSFFTLTDSFMRDPVKILVKNDELTLEGIKQYYIYMEYDSYKFDTLCDLYASFTIAQSILYCNSKRTVEFLQNKLTENNFSNAYIHGNMPQTKRKEIMNEFRSGGIRMLISTDLLCRGIDVQQVSLVINYEVPYKTENYIHRIGRSGRFGRKGIAINFANDRELKQLKDIEKYYSTTVESFPKDISSVFH